jgi:hypothetical protein
VTRGREAVRLPVLVIGLVSAAVGEAACLSIVAHPGGPALASIPVAGSSPAFTVSYVHSATRTPVDERYRIAGDVIVQDAIAFSTHGPGLPTEPDAGGRFEQRDGRFVMTMRRRMPSIVMRVHADQSPRLVAAGSTHDLAAWGNRSLALSATANGCAAH